ncbi:MAG: heptaprenyl diphosphate synthase component 1 [Sporolactobacillus sp.]
MSFIETVEKLATQLKTELSHPYVDRALGAPEIDRDKLAVYYTIFKQGPAALLLTRVNALMAAEIGLATHEQMTRTEGEGHQSILERQLVTLSGDYYSALYYFWLAKDEQRELTHWVAQAIQEYNVIKSQLYYPSAPLSADQLTHLLERLESQLVVTMTDYAGRSDLKPLLQSFFLLKRLCTDCWQSASESTRYLISCLSSSGASLTQHIQMARRQVEQSLSACCQDNSDDRTLSAYLKERAELLWLSAAGEGQKQ